VLEVLRHTSSWSLGDTLNASGMVSLALGSASEHQPLSDHHLIRIEVQIDFN
jgi:hypothetical protein